MSEYICPHCKNPIYDDEAILCLYCGQSLDRAGKHFPRSRMLFLLILLILIVSFTLLMLR